MRRTIPKVLLGFLTVLVSLAMAQTASAGMTPTVMNVSPTSVEAEGTITVNGSNCIGYPVDVYVDEVLVDTVTTGLTGAWSTDIVLDGDVGPGEHVVDAVCNGIEGPQFSYTGVTFVVTGGATTTTTTEPAPTTTEAGAPTTTEAAAPTTTEDSAAAGATDEKPEAELAYTGQNHTPQIMVGVMTVAAGLVLLLTRRRLTA